MTNSTSPSLVSGAVFIGVDVSDPSALPVDIFKDRTNHITALSSILAHSSKKTSFSPSHHSPQQQDPQQKTLLVSAYNAFIQDAISFHGFHETRFRETKALSLHGSLVQFEQAIREFLSSGEGEWNDALFIARSLRDLIPAQLSKASATETSGDGQWILSLIVLRQEAHSESSNSSSKVYVQHAQVTMDIFRDDNHDTQGLAYIPEQSAKFEIGELELLAPSMIQGALELSQEIPIVKLHSRSGMDMADDTLFAIQNLFYSGAYTQVISESAVALKHTQPSTLTSSAYHQLSQYLYRSLLATKDYARVAQEINEHSALGLQALKAQAVYLDAVHSADPNGRDAALSHLREMVQVARGAAMQQVVAAHVPADQQEKEVVTTESEVKVALGQALANEGLVEEALAVMLPHGNHLESAAVVIQIYLQMNRLDLAKKELESVKAWAEDAMLAQQMEAWVGLRTGGGERYQNAYYIFEEIATSSTQPTVKSLIGEAVCNIQMGELALADNLLQEASAKEPHNTDVLVNQIVLATLMSKPAEQITAFVQQLQAVAPNHIYLQELDLKSSLFDRAAQRFAIA
ncbi:hypothetical protein DFQ27_001328 [Actinomortierella ambigua]|uniref:Coatomer subunit epsilon n=1 Tax=Actinomortierella ambigua TaxID=1343610 RepID=A0A9P6QBN3_9FUNG|nr:hypothetical protein DFQ27_001328 [Actinomortierella ambigua]